MATESCRHKAIRERFQRERPTMEELLVSGEYVGPFPQGAYREMRGALHQLKHAREASGLSLSDVAERSGIDKAFLSRLENGLQANPTIETLMRYATALGKRLRWSVEDAAATQ